MPGTDPLKVKPDNHEGNPPAKPLGAVPTRADATTPSPLNVRRELQTRHIGESPTGEVPALSGFIKPAVIELLTMDQIIELLGLLTDELRKRREGEAGAARETHRVGATKPAPSIAADLAKVDDSDYRILPTRMASRMDAVQHGLRFVLFSADETLKPIAVRALGDLIVGRNVEGASCDLNLTPYDITPPAISRVHALIRPTADRLFLSDLDSTNGTYIDGERVKPRQVITLEDGSLITFGKTHFKLRIVPPKA